MVTLFTYRHFERVAKERKAAETINLKTAVEFHRGLPPTPSRATARHGSPHFCRAGTVEERDVGAPSIQPRLASRRACIGRHVSSHVCDVVRDCTSLIASDVQRRATSFCVCIQVGRAVPAIRSVMSKSRIERTVATCSKEGWASCPTRPFGEEQTHPA